MGIVMYMATYRLPNPRNYWTERLETITKHFTVNRFEQLLSSIHFNSEASSKGSLEKSGEKVQPLIEFINARLSLLTMSKELCIDEMMVSSKSKYGPRVYQKGKPHPWGFKLFGISDMYGIVYLMHLHCGKFPQVHPFPNLGSTGNRVLWLIQNVPRNQNYNLYMDNYFNSIPLMNELLKIGIHSMGTIRIPNAAGFSQSCIPDKELTDLGDRAFVEYIASFEGSIDPGIRILRWNDSKIFNFAHTSGSAHPTTKKERWHRGKDNRCHKTEIDMPSVIGKYNKCMGGIDKMDSMIGMFPCKMKVRRWPMSIFFHIIDITVGNAWLLYQIEYEKTYHNKKYLSQYHFKRYISECWMKQNECTANRRLRHSVGRSSQVPRSVRFDGKNHLPGCTDGRSGRKQCAKCQRSTNVYCTKCNVHLCMYSKRNCYKPYHTVVDRVNIINNADNDQESDAADDVELQDNAGTDCSESF